MRGRLRLGGFGLPAAICGVLATLSLIPLSQVTGPDPNAWMSWSYGLIRSGGIDYGFGPSWKPLPVLVTAPLNLAGPEFTAIVWLWIVRFASFWCSAMLYRLVQDGSIFGQGAAGSSASRPGSFALRFGGAIAALLPLTIRPWVNTTIVGESETVALAFVLTALVAFLAGRQRVTTVLLVLAGLLRPETWPLLAIQLIWRRRAASAQLARDTVAALGAIAIFWFVFPQIVSSGGTPLAMQGGYSLKDATLHTIYSNVLGVMPPKAWLLIPFGFAGAMLARRTAPLLLGVGAILLIVEITVLWALHPPITAAGYTPVLRYFAVAGVMLCGVAGAGAAAIVEWAPARAPRVAAVAAVLALVSWSGWTSIDGTRSAIDRARDAGRSSQQAVEAIEKAGGTELLRNCEPWTISNWSAIGWSISRRLGIPLGSIRTKPHTPSIALDFTEGGWVLRTPPPDDQRGRKVIAVNGPWEIVHYPGARGCLPPGTAGD